MQCIHILDSHTGGEPTRLVISGGPDLGNGSMAQRLDRFCSAHDDFRSAVVNEPRGSDVIVGALLCEPGEPSCTAGVIFFNNVGYLGMCGHGTIGLIASLAYLNRIQPGVHRIETPVGVVEATLHESPLSLEGRGGEREGEGENSFLYPTRVTVRNVPSYRHASSVTVNVEGVGRVTGDVAWGGNWFFLINDHGQTIQPFGELKASSSNIQTLTDYTSRVKDALARSGITGAASAEIDHIELFAPSHKPGVNSKNFVLCPGKAYDRSPCGTGTSAKMACLYADGKLKPGQVWRQESIVGSVFEGTIELDADGHLIPSITGEAFVTAEAELIADPRDPFRLGIRSSW